ncbi:MAG TPA: hypothetical protein VN903_28720 [Polyangia bacterium]|nr:hypothetical protein [Polyangia bacterium]
MSLPRSRPEATLRAVLIGVGTALLISIGTAAWRAKENTWDHAADIANVRRAIDILCDMKENVGKQACQPTFTRSP